MHKKGIYEKYFKRPFDVLVSILSIILLSPLIAAVAITVRIKLGFPVIFKQQRPGLNENVFTLYKFRTMNDKKDKQGNLLQDGERLTKFGKFLRSTSLDELPEIINILKGNMSIVGPRPQLIEDKMFMTDEQRLRHCVRPGLTGLAQINGRNNISWDEKFQLDLEYIKNITFWGDIKIIIITAIKVFKRSDITEKGKDTGDNLGQYLLNTNKINEKQYKDIIDKGATDNS